MYIVRNFYKGRPGYRCLQEAVRAHYLKHYGATPEPQPDLFVCLTGSNGGALAMPVPASATATRQSCSVSTTWIKAWIDVMGWTALALPKWGPLHRFVAAAEQASTCWTM